MAKPQARLNWMRISRVSVGPLRCGRSQRCGRLRRSCSCSSWRAPRCSRCTRQPRAAPAAPRRAARSRVCAGRLRRRLACKTARLPRGGRQSTRAARAGTAAARRRRRIRRVAGDPREPGTAVALIFTTGTVSTQEKLAATSTTSRSRRSSASRRRRWRTACVYLGDFALLKFYGTFDWLTDRKKLGLTSTGSRCSPLITLPAAARLRLEAKTASAPSRTSTAPRAGRRRSSTDLGRRRRRAQGGGGGPRGGARPRLGRDEPPSRTHDDEFKLPEMPDFGKLLGGLLVDNECIACFSPQIHAHARSSRHASSSSMVCGNGGAVGLAPCASHTTRRQAAAAQRRRRASSTRRERRPIRRARRQRTRPSADTKTRRPPSYSDSSARVIEASAWTASVWGMHATSSFRPCGVAARRRSTKRGDSARRRRSGEEVRHCARRRPLRRRRRQLRARPGELSEVEFEVFRRPRRCDGSGRAPRAGGAHCGIDSTPRCTSGAECSTAPSAEPAVAARRMWPARSTPIEAPSTASVSCRRVQREAGPTARAKPSTRLSTLPDVVVGDAVVRELLALEDQTLLFGGCLPLPRASPSGSRSNWTERPGGHRLAHERLDEDLELLFGSVRAPPAATTRRSSRHRRHVRHERRRLASGAHELRIHAPKRILEMSRREPAGSGVRSACTAHATTQRRGNVLLDHIRQHVAPAGLRGAQPQRLDGRRRRRSAPSRCTARARPPRRGVRPRCTTLRRLRRRPLRDLVVDHRTALDTKARCRRSRSHRCCCSISHRPCTRS